MFGCGDVPTDPSRRPVLAVTVAEYDGNDTSGRNMNYNNVNERYNNKSLGQSARCVADNP